MEVNILRSNSFLDLKVDLLNARYRVREREKKILVA